VASPSPAHDDSRPLMLLVEDEVLARIGMTATLERAGFRVAPTASAEEALEVLSVLPGIRAVITDVELSPDGMDGFGLTQAIQIKWPSIQVLIVSGCVSPGPDRIPPKVHFISKPLHGATLLHVIQNLVNAKVEPAPKQFSKNSFRANEKPGLGRPNILTQRQQTVLQLLVQGKSNRRIAQALNLSENTIKVHVAALFRTLGVSSRVEAVLIGKPLLERIMH
jgi:DNA-binding NarL/FixJ family response regulator